MYLKYADTCNNRKAKKLLKIWKSFSILETCSNLQCHIKKTGFWTEVKMSAEWKQRKKTTKTRIWKSTISKTKQVIWFLPGMLCCVRNLEPKMPELFLFYNILKWQWLNLTNFEVTYSYVTHFFIIKKNILITVFGYNVKFCLLLIDSFNLLVFRTIFLSHKLKQPISGRGSAQFSLRF